MLDVTRLPNGEKENDFSCWLITVFFWASTHHVTSDASGYYGKLHATKPSCSMTTTDPSSEDREQMYEGAREKAAAEIHERALLYSESRVYRLNNQYLSERQKVDVEMWFGAPVELFYIGVGASMLLKQSLLAAVFMSSVFSIAFMEYFFWNANSTLFYFCHRAVLSAARGHILIIGLLLGSVLFSGSAWWMVTLVLGIYFLTALSPTVFSSVIFHGNKMHPKYAFAKRRFALHYPWDLVDV
jgi:hypothetical protein